jgi:hypothetical protein
MVGAFFADSGLFQKVSQQLDWSALGPEFVADREKLTGRKIDPQRAKQASALFLHQLRALLHMLETMLSDGRHFLNGGDIPSLFDVHAYAFVWFLANPSVAMYAPARQLLQQTPYTNQWQVRMEDLGGTVATSISEGDARDIATRSSPPRTRGFIDPGEPVPLQKGQLLTVSPDDYGRVPVLGKLESSSVHHVTLLREHPQIGSLSVTFPRMGYILMPPKHEQREVKSAL